MLLFLIILICAVIFIKKNKDYKETEYYEQTHISLLGVWLDKGRYGEYLIYKYLSKLSGTKKYLFNCYVPKEDGSTTEIDVILLHDSGIYIFESKNYSGWIFGTETSKNWTQTLPAGKGKSHKEHFFNPIMQNKGHVKWLQKYMDNCDLPFYSVIVFSDRCTLKEINLTSNRHWVINRYDVRRTVEGNATKVGILLSEEQINMIHQKLYPLTQSTEELRQLHIQQVQEQQNPILPKEGVTSVSPVVHNDTERTCPKCGAVLTLRIAKKGERAGQQFWGCTNFPKCRYIENV